MPIVGDVLAERYRIDAPIGVGGMASVYRATDLRGAARDRTARLSSHLDKIDGHVQGASMEQLKTAISNLVEAIPSG